MKKALSIIALLAATLSASAQTIYLCKDGEYTTAQLSEGLQIDLTAGYDSITFAQPQIAPTVTISYNGASAAVKIPSTVQGVTSTVNGAHVTINSTNQTDEITYKLSGTSADGSLTLNGSYKLTLQLAGLDLTSKKGAAIDIQCGKRIDVILKDGTVNTLADNASGDQKAALYFKGHPEFKGGGTLNVTGNAKHAIAAKEYLVFKASLGTVNILKAVSDGIHCGKGEKSPENNYFQMNGGTVNISNCGSDCIDADDYGHIKIRGGKLDMDISQTDGSGLKADSLVTMTGGNITFSVSGDITDAIRANYAATFAGGTINGTLTGKGTRGIRAKKCTKSTDTVLNGGHLYFSGTNVSLTVSGGTYTADQTKTYGIKADQTLTQTAGAIDINVTNSQASDINAKTDNWTGGSRNGTAKSAPMGAYSVSISECKERGNDATRASIDEGEYIEYSATRGTDGQLYLHLKHVNAYYCCDTYGIDCQATLSDGEIKVTETPLMYDMEDCYCPYDVTLDAGPLQPGKYNVVYGSKYKSYAQFTIDLKEGLTGTFNIKDNYGWH